MPASPVYPEQTAMPYSTPFTRPAMPQARPHTVHSTVPDEMPPTAQDSIDDEDDQATPRASLANVSTLPERSLPRDDTATDLSLPPPSFRQSATVMPGQYPTASLFYHEPQEQFRNWTEGNAFTQPRVESTEAASILNAQTVKEYEREDRSIEGWVLEARHTPCAYEEV
ncbi:hypothetical protein KC368_g17726 [Hortaea werneckii]|nr:hypothetical protein KC368_g17726 [Hortaea werneckii]